MQTAVGVGGKGLEDWVEGQSDWAKKEEKKKRKIQPDLYNIMLFVLQDAIRKENVYRLEENIQLYLFLDYMII